MNFGPFFWEDQAGACLMSAEGVSGAPSPLVRCGPQAGNRISSCPGFGSLLALLLFGGKRSPALASPECHKSNPNSTASLAQPPGCAEGLGVGFGLRHCISVRLQW